MKPGLAGQSANPKGSRRRRFWSSDEKRRMVAESFAPGASVSKVAQRYGVNANLLFTWRRRDARSAASGGLEAVKLLPGHCQSKLYTSCSRTTPGWSSTVFAHELLLRSAGFDAENRLYLFALTVPWRRLLSGLS